MSLLGAQQTVYIPLEVREQVEAKPTKIDRLGVLVNSESESYVDEVKARETGRIVCRDIGDSDLERMSPPEYVPFSRLCVAVCTYPHFLSVH